MYPHADPHAASLPPAPVPTPRARWRVALAWGLATLALGLVTAAGAAPPDDWPLHGRDYAAARHSPLSAITPANVARLERKWSWRSGVKATFQTTPIVVDGVMYVSLPYSHVAALDAASGRERWRYRHVPRTDKLCCGPANRGVAVAGGRVFVGTVDARLVALDAGSGAVLWDVPVAAGDTGTESAAALDRDDALTRQGVTGSTGVGIAMAPQVVGDRVLVGITGVGYGLHLDNAVVGMPGAFGRAGFLAAFDAASGQRRWQFDVTRPGWEGEFRARTANGADLNRDLAAERAAAPNHAEAWRHGGGSIWSTPAVDVERGLIYFGTGNPSPQMEDSTRPGDNLHTCALVALELATGRLVWAHQQVPHDRWGYDVASPPVLMQLNLGGQPVPAVAQASKLGWVFVHDRRDGRLLYTSEPFVPQRNLFANATPEGITIAPGIAGGANWTPMSYDAARGLFFVAALHAPTRYQERSRRLPDGSTLRYVSSELQGSERSGRLTALDLRDDGRIRWQVNTEEPLLGGVLSTAGGLVFTGVGKGEFAAFDAATGRRLWSHQASAGVNAPPVSYAVGGRQFVAVAAGGNALFGFAQGDEVVAFALPD